MAAPTPQIYTRQTGEKGLVVWNAVWADTTNLTTSIVVNLSDQLDGKTNSLTIEQLRYRCTAGIEFTLLFDATSNEFLYTSILGETEWIMHDFTLGDRVGLFKSATGSTGDLVLTTTSAAAADEVSLLIYYRAK
jgi:hypothetical protein